MNAYKEFQGKTLDDAIQEACDYFGVAREKLEIDIVNDAKSGIFGLVGAKKASIRASKVRLSDLLSDEGNPADVASVQEVRPSEMPVVPPKAGGEKRSEVRPSSGKRARGGGNAQNPADGREKGAPLAGEEKKSAPGEEDARSRKGERRSVPGKEGQEQASRKRSMERHQVKPVPVVKLSENGDGASPHEDFPEYDPQSGDTGALLHLVKETVIRLGRPIVGELNVNVALAGARVRVSIDCGEYSGLLLGREGQTLAALQYITGRIVAKSMGGSVRLQFDAGNYREKQDERFRKLALSLAEKAKASRRAQSTRPLSAYQRRIVHLTLEKDAFVQTFSKGEGNQRRVIVQLKRGDGAMDSAHPENQELEEAFEADLDASLNAFPENMPQADRPVEILDEALDIVLDGILEDARNKETQ